MAQLLLTNVDDVDALIMGVENPTVVVTVKGPPIAQARPRVRVFNGRARVYDPDQREKRAYRRAIRQAMAQLGITDFPFFERRVLKLNVTFGLSNNAKDVDNLLKFVMDALESVVYDNDAWIVDVHAKKTTVLIAQQYTSFELEEVEVE
jgi:Holliday junction resolvase RusA-like endonuclease